MALIDEGVATDDPVFFRKVAIAASRAVMNALAAGSPPANQIALGKRFLLSPESETRRYLLPVAARLVINGVAVNAATDAQINTAVSEVLTANLTAGVT